MDAAQAVTDKVAAPTRMASLVAVPLHGIMDPKLLGLATIHKAAAGNEDTKISTTGTRSTHSPSQIPTALQILSTCPILSMLPTRNMRPTSSTLLILNTRQTSSMLQISSSTKLPAPNPTAPAHKPALIQAPPGHRDNAARRAAEATNSYRNSRPQSRGRAGARSPTPGRNNPGFNNRPPNSNRQENFRAIQTADEDSDPDEDLDPETIDRYVEHYLHLQEKCAASRAREQSEN